MFYETWLLEEVGEDARVKFHCFWYLQSVYCMIRYVYSVLLYLYYNRNSRAILL